MKNKLKKIIIIVLWLILWEAVARFIRNDVLLVGPLRTARALFQMTGTAAFLHTAVTTWSKILLGLLAGGVTGVLLGLCAFRFPFCGDLFAPFVTAVKSIPVACFVVLLLIRAGTAYLSLIVSALIVFPVFYFQTIQGLQGADRELIEIADVFAMPRTDRIRQIYIPALYPFFLSAVRTGAGTAWKAGVAAEVIGQRTGTLGNEIYRAKALLATEHLFAVTVVVIALSWMTEKVLLAIVKRAGRYLEDL